MRAVLAVEFLEQSNKKEGQGNKKGKTEAGCFGFVICVAGGVLPSLCAWLAAYNFC